MDLPDAIYKFAVMILMLNCAAGIALALFASIGYFAVRSFVRNPAANAHQGWVDALQVVKYGTLFGALLTIVAMFAAIPTTDAWSIRFVIVVLTGMTTLFLLIAYEAISGIRRRLEPRSELA